MWRWCKSILTMNEVVSKEDSLNMELIAKILRQMSHTNISIAFSETASVGYATFITYATKTRRKKLIIAEIPNANNLQGEPLDHCFQQLSKKN